MERDQTSSVPPEADTSVLVFLQLLRSCGQRPGVTTASSSLTKCTGFLNIDFPTIPYQKDADQRKVRGGAQVRRETGMKSLERGMEQNLMLNKSVDKSMEVQIALSGVKKLCEKKGEKGKCQ